MAQPQPRGGGGGGAQTQQGQGKAPASAPPAAHQGPIKYGDAFAVKGDLAGQPIAPRDAAAMRAAESGVPGVPVPQESGGGFSVGGFMEQAAQYNQALGAVQPGQASDAAARGGVNVAQEAVPGGRIVTEFVAGQAVGQYAVAEAPAEQAKAAAGSQGAAAGRGGGAPAGRRN
ncbi:hypothetical protein ACP70R_023532 [Stipagrostis hirtigluma subsp. patula]